MMPFARVADWIPRLSPADGQPILDMPTVGVAPFSDDLEPTPGHRIGLRAFLRDRPAGGYTVDFSDVGPPSAQTTDFALTPELVRTAATLAVAAGAKRTEDPALLLEVVEVICPSTTWVGAGAPGSNPAAVAMAMARVFDVVMGALAHVWPSRVGAGSCSLGAIVELESGSETFTEVLPGGEGAAPDRNGRDAWSGPILETRTPVGLPGWLSVEQLPRKGSGGIGARNGGDGIVRRYHLEASVRARAAIDRFDNPPHGIDRAGPPKGSQLYVEGPDHVVVPAPRWETFRVAAGQTLVVETCGGAGHGFPGYGDIDWSPD